MQHNHNNQGDVKNMMLAGVLALIILILWQVFYLSPRNEELRKEAQAQKAKQELQMQEQASRQPSETPQSPAAKLSRKSHDELLEQGTDTRVMIESDALKGSISLRGARIDDLILTKYRQAAEGESPHVVLFAPSNNINGQFAEFGWLNSGAQGIALPDKNSIWQVEGDAILRAGGSVTLHTRTDDALFRRTISLDENYMFTITQEVENLSDKQVSLHTYGLINRVDPQMHKNVDGFEEPPGFGTHEGAIGVFGSILEEETYEDIAEEREMAFRSDGGGWAGITDKYWLSTIIPDQAHAFSATFTAYEKEGITRFQTDIMGPKVSTAPGGKTSATYRLFAGAKELDVLDAYRDEGVPLFDRAVDFGFLYFLARPIFLAMHELFLLTGNFGLAIIIFTIFMKILLYPLASKSYRSMSKMKALAPEIKQLQERFKDDKMKLSQETMKFYRERNVNPASGCLPILLQMPVFFALLRVLYASIEMRHAPFYGWITDLSAPDPTTIFTLFGLVPWDVWSILPSIGVLPILCGLTMLLQQKLNPPPNDPTQAMMMKWLPFVFTILFASFPAGLVLYWTWGNILSIIQQYIISRNIDK